MRFVDDYLAYLLARASHLVSSAHHARLAARGVPVPVWRVLATLADGEPMTIGELAARCLMKQPTLTKLVDRMEREGLVRRLPVEGDRRKVQVTITAEGRKQVEPLMIEAKELEREALAGIEPEQAQLLKAVLRHLLARLSEPERRQPECAREHGSICTCFS